MAQNKIIKIGSYLNYDGDNPVWVIRFSKNISENELHKLEDIVMKEPGHLLELTTKNQITIEFPDPYFETQKQRESYYISVEGMLEKIEKKFPVFAIIFVPSLSVDIKDLSNDALLLYESVNQSRGSKKLDMVAEGLRSNSPIIQKIAAEKSEILLGTKYEEEFLKFIKLDSESAKIANGKLKILQIKVAQNIRQKPEKFISLLNTLLSNFGVNPPIIYMLSVASVFDPEVVGRMLSEYANSKDLSSAYNSILKQLQEKKDENSEMALAYTNFFLNNYKECLFHIDEALHYIQKTKHLKTDLFKEWMLTLKQRCLDKS